MLGQNFVIAMPAEVLVPDGARSSAGLALTEKLNLYKFLWL